MIDYKVGHIRLESNNDNLGEYVELKGPIILKMSEKSLSSISTGIQIQDMDDYLQNWREYGVGIKTDFKYSLYFEDGFCIIEVIE